MDMGLRTGSAHSPQQKKLTQLLGKKIKFYTVPYAKELSCFRGKLTCVLCKRMMYRLAEGIAGKESADGIVTGENLGQVASQTLENLLVIRKAVNIQVIQPLIAFNKTETIDKARELGLYEIVSRKTEGCSAVPKEPRTKATLEEVLEAESEMDIPKLVQGSLEKAEVREV